MIGRIFAAILLVAFVGSCSRPPELVGIEDQAKPVAAVQPANIQKVYIVTTRQASEAVGAFYSGERAPELGFASVAVSIPPNHVAGSLERPKSLPPDPMKEFAIIQPVVYGTETSFVSALNNSLAALPRADQEILFFVHGYNNTISDSILRMAQFVEDTGFEGVPVLFSWASAAKPTHYVYDLNSALTARPFLLEAARVLEKSRAVGFDLFAHSMGGFLTMEAIVQASIAGDFNRSGRIRNIMLAAPDIDLDLFKTQMDTLAENQQDIYILVSENDQALGFSKRISGGVERVGSADAEELAGLGVTVIDVSAIDDSTSGEHSKFAGSPEIVQLIGQGLRQGNLIQGRETLLSDMLDGLPILVVGSN